MVSTNIEFLYTVEKFDGYVENLKFQCYTGNIIWQIKLLPKCQRNLYNVDIIYSEVWQILHKLHYNFKDRNNFHLLSAKSYFPVNLTTNTNMVVHVQH